MEKTIQRRGFLSLGIGAAAGLVCAPQMAWAYQSKLRVSTKPYSPVVVQYQPGVFVDRYADLGGVLDTTNGLLWGYEPYAGMINTGTGGSVVYNFDPMYKRIVSDIAAYDTSPTRREIYAATYSIIAPRVWRAPTVFEARDAVAKGLFTFGDQGCNLFFAAPEATAPGVSYGLGNLRWTSSVASNGLTHVWSLADGGTQLVPNSGGSSLMMIVVSRI